MTDAGLLMPPPQQQSGDEEEGAPSSRSSSSFSGVSSLKDMMAVSPSEEEVQHLCLSCECAAPLVLADRH